MRHAKQQGVKLTWSARCCHQLGLVLEPTRPVLCRVAELLLLLVSRLLDDDTNSSAAQRFSCLACWDDGVHTALGTDIPLSGNHRCTHCTSGTQQRGRHRHTKWDTLRTCRCFPPNIVGGRALPLCMSATPSRQRDPATRSSYTRSITVVHVDVSR